MKQTILLALLLGITSYPVTSTLAEAPEGMAEIPAGPFDMGDSMGEGSPAERPVHTVNISAFYIDTHEVTKPKWDEVAEWAVNNGYDINPDSASVQTSESDHPVHSVNWFKCIKWCNARSEKEGLKPVYYADVEKTVVMRTGNPTLSNDHVDWAADGYRLPTEAEWEKAARGGAVGKRFPWSDTTNINHSLANYISRAEDSFDNSQTRGHHPGVQTANPPGSNPVGFFEANGYGLYDVAGNMWEWCWDRYSPDYYANSPAENPRGPVEGSGRSLRGGSWDRAGYFCRVSGRNNATADNTYNRIGFRTARNAK